VADPDRPAWTLGVEEEVMLLDAETLALAPAIEEVLDALPQHLRERPTSETHAGCASWRALGAHEVLDEKRFLAARDGTRAELIDLDRERVHALLDFPGAQRQRDAAGPEGDFGGLLGSLADAFCGPGGAVPG
jgi:ABC-type polar amino acid transport system ATPase subunit